MSSQSLPYITYCRKSTDEEDRQVLSLEDQQDLDMELAIRNKLYAPKSYWFSESMSAKKPGRPIFNKVIDLVMSGKAAGIIAYKVDRLTRNMHDSAVLIDVIEAGKEIWCTDTGLIRNTATDKMMFGFNALQAKNKIDGLSEDVIRGMTSKVKDGCWAGVAPLGYLNLDELGKIAGKYFDVNKQLVLENKIREEGRKIERIEQDPLIAPFMRRAFEVYAYENTTIRDLCDQLYEEGLRTKQGKKISVTSMHQLLRNSFYCGYFKWKKKLYKGSHQALISEELFQDVNSKLAKRAHFNGAVPIERSFTYRGLLYCICGSSLITDPQTKKQQNGKTHHYRYYRCARNNGTCNQPYVEQKKLEPQLASIFESFMLSRSQTIELKSKLKELFDRDSNYQAEQEQGLREKLTKLTNQKKALARKILTDEIEDLEMFKAVKTDIESELQEIKRQLETISGHTEDWLEQSSNLFYLAKHAKELFLQATDEEKVFLLRLTCSNLTIRDKKIEFTLAEPFNYLKQAHACPIGLPVHELIRNLHQFIAAPDVIGAKMSLFSAS